MTCKQMGGPCDAPIHGDTAEEMLDNGALHIAEMVNDDDEAHEKVQDMLDKMQEDPKSKAAWDAKFLQDFAALPED